MTLRQIFGWTQPEQAPPGKYVRFMAVSESTDKDEFNFSIRGDDCIFKSITLPGDSAVEMALMIIFAARNKDLAEAGLPPLTSPLDV